MIPSSAFGVAWLAGKATGLFVLIFLVACAPAKPVPVKARAGSNVVERKAAGRLYHQGVEQYLAGNLRGAIRTWNRTLEMDPQHRDAQRSIQRARSELALLNQRAK